MFRAAHLLYDDSPKVFEDPYAFDLLGSQSRVFLKVRPLFRLFEALYPIRSARGQVLVRARFAEDRLQAAIARNVRQYVILGAGLDSYALRAAVTDPRLRVFELDRGDRKEKAARVRELGRGVAADVHYVEIDFETGSLLPRLGSDFEPSQPTFFSWLGLMHYMERTTVLRTLQQISGCAAPGSEMVFDYAEPSETSGRTAEGNQVESGMRRQGEPLQSYFSIDEFSRWATTEGWRVAEHLTANEQRAKYLAGRVDRLDVLDGFSLAALERPAS